MKCRVKVYSATGIVDVVDEYDAIQWSYDNDYEGDTESEVKFCVDNAYEAFEDECFDYMFDRYGREYTATDIINIAEDIKAIKDALYKATVSIDNVEFIIQGELKW